MVAINVLLHKIHKEGLHTKMSWVIDCILCKRDSVHTGKYVCAQVPKRNTVCCMFVCTRVREGERVLEGKREEGTNEHTRICSTRLLRASLLTKSVFFFSFSLMLLLMQSWPEVENMMSVSSSPPPEKHKIHSLGIKHRGMETLSCGKTTWFTNFSFFFLLLIWG